jgi:hypothetical protein
MEELRNRDLEEARSKQEAEALILFGNDEVLVKTSSIGGSSDHRVSSIGAFVTGKATTPLEIATKSSTEFDCSYSQNKANIKNSIKKAIDKGNKHDKTIDPTHLYQIVSSNASKSKIMGRN